MGNTGRRCRCRETPWSSEEKRLRHKDLLLVVDGGAAEWAAGVGGALHIAVARPAKNVSTCKHALWRWGDNAGSGEDLAEDTIAEMRRGLYVD